MRGEMLKHTINTLFLLCVLMGEILIGMAIGTGIIYIGNEIHNEYFKDKEVLKELKETLKFRAPANKEKITQAIEDGRITKR